MKKKWIIEEEEEVEVEEEEEEEEEEEVKKEVRVWDEVGRGSLRADLIWSIM